MITENLSFSGISAAFLCILVILSKKEVKHSDKYLMLWMGISSLNIAYYLYSSLIPYFLQSFGFTMPVLSTGFLLLYVTSLTFNRTFEGSIILKSALPYLIYNVFFIIVTIAFGEMQFNYGVPRFGSGTHTGILNLLTVPMAIVPIIYIVLCFFALQKYQRLLPEFYSFLEKINLNWLKYTLLSLIGLFLIIYAIILSSTKFDLIPIDRTFGIVAAIQSAFLFSIAFFSLRQSIIVDYSIILEPQIETHSKNSKPDEKLDELAAKLLEFMENEKPYLAEELSLSTLAKEMNISTNTLSQVINQNLDTNFYKFVNSYRTDEVKKMLKDPLYTHYSILGVAYEAGFNSKSTFNKIFREETGMTPSEFRKS